MYLLILGYFGVECTRASKPNGMGKENPSFDVIEGQEALS